MQWKVLFSHCTRDGIPALLNCLIAAFLGEPLANLIACAGALDKVQPVLARPGVWVLGGEHLDDVACSQCGLEGDEATINLGAHGAVSDFGMHRVGEVDGCRPGRKPDDTPLRGEYVDLFGTDLIAKGVEKFTRVGCFGLPVGNMRQPRHIGVTPETGTRALTVDLLLVLPMRCHTELGPLVHLLGANLNLNRPPARPENCRVERLVKVEFRRGDVVLETAG